jgi:hypothetical protein
MGCTPSVALGKVQPYSQVIFPNGSHIRLQQIPNSGNDYCIYRDIQNNLIYTGDMKHYMYDGWGAIWDSTGSWPQIITLWSKCKPSIDLNIVLYITEPVKGHCIWYKVDENKHLIFHKQTILNQPCKMLFHNIIHDAKHYEFTRDKYHNIHKLLMIMCFNVNDHECIHTDMHVINPLANMRTPPKIK